MEDLTWVEDEEEQFAFLRKDCPRSSYVLNAEKKLSESRYFKSKATLQCVVEAAV
jgi:hypothetical protein